MRSTVVPAQVTTVEDRIAGNIGVSQLMLLLAPVFGGGILYVFLPPFFGYSIYKIVVLVTFAVICSVLAIRIKGQIVLKWIIAIVTYNSRPRFYVANKNHMHGRDKAQKITFEDIEQKALEKVRNIKSTHRLSTQELVNIESILANPKANLRFSTDAKGELRVHITEVQ